MRKAARHPVAETVTADDLKICELCGALNLASNRNCFGCGWHGKFEERREIVRVALDLTLQQFGSLCMGDITEGLNEDAEMQCGPVGALKRCFRRIRSWLFG